LTTIEFILLILFMLPKNATSFWSWFFDPNAELAAGATFSSVQLIAIALTWFAVAWRATTNRLRVYAWAVMLIFMLLAVDEYYALHETILQWRAYYAGVGLALLLATVAIFRFVIRGHYRLMLLLLGGISVMGLGGVAVEIMSNQHRFEIGSYRINFIGCDQFFLGIDCNSLNFAEEFLEMHGATIILVTLLYYLHTTSLATWRPGRRIIAGGSAVWAAWLLGSLWLLPTAQGLLLADSIQAQYLDGDLSLVRYDVSQHIAAPGDTLDVSLYFRANRFLDADYSLSVMLFAQPTVESIAQSDLLLGEWKYPSRAWLPGLMVRNDVRLHLPDDLPASRSYQLVARVWQGEWPSGVAIDATDRAVTFNDTLILEDIPVLTGDTPPPPPMTSDYHFADGIRLVGYDVPRTVTPGESVTVNFWWATAQAIDRNLTQFIHLVPVDGAAEDFIGFDRQPFDGAFPTADWPADMTVRDEWTLQLPDDMPPGDYRVQVGLYDATTIERAAVTNGDGTPIADNSIPLVTIHSRAS